ncbi:30S ribosomal protein S5 [Candidatus Woesebacteria bacterium RIFCSPHIGHO2_01_FULL_44_10]|uniref:Small ribosomal subunit protein uS5 n=1 Tax=Candidatus Woesebacteria bacterium RIFCSPLOWO2_01_FULL_44_14 TaxID=1802525 RepID=A0A1F8C1E1_9BACT|nr:MAG: 30S ribosomal protein S5 [Candidatus Woesebacteria bacterium RIFCSPHIGHO2_01_FULL_44_10]OGM54710.1 MAG: 30S ribosomal protein S5 [Candidatus Woesebacteria bacterium RIFCSPHIGHO2_12_FULL_44_11]OGM70181.1 MAG: 30S ribosomal protein S5 [Candidatus Woesebacteria bacterium RIFCSPLOWO2_01_FULL_44_14]
MAYQNYAQQERDYEVVKINRISKKTKGGNQVRFSALVVAGDKKGKVGAGLQKASDVRSAIEKAAAYAKRRMITVALMGTTIPHEVAIKFGAAKIILKPAPAGTGIIAGGAVRVVLEAAGIRDAVGKILGTKNKISNVYATIEALEKVTKYEKRKKS